MSIRLHVGETVELALDDLHPSYANVVPDTIFQLTERYPWGGPVRVQLYGKTGDRSLGFTKGNTISLNRFWFCQPRAVLQKAAAEGAQHGVRQIAEWHDAMTDEPAHLLTHEYGHVLEPVLQRRTRGNFDDFRERLFAIVRRDPRSAPTGYCLVDEAENWAETFACGHLGDQATNDQVIAVRRYLDAI